MPLYDYPVFQGKLMVLLGNFSSLEECRAWYFDRHVLQIASTPRLEEYRANILVQPKGRDIASETNGSDPYGVQAVDEIKGLQWEEIRDSYDASHVIGVYNVTEYMIRELHTDRPIGIKTPEMKRIAMLSKPLDKSHDEAMEYWLDHHPTFCFRHHTGMASYSQNHVDAIMTENSVSIDGFAILTYWNENAYKYGHFSMKDSKQLMMKDCRNFRSTSFVFTVEEYIMK